MSSSSEITGPSAKVGRSQQPASRAGILMLFSERSLTCIHR